ncbi:hypothetical protein GA0074695_4708 [Micromonospora viridifaciens]|uniref:S1 motif domain-containing protein n=1 Tax=Micromonospora viridifaciens TaxID=1881 RepID=A0A1C4YUM4_MICVI|nr:hypothetical protein [Micromonospora viridifaciens]SCF24398.1 hypothetical protein GA0074695_4708 [Micromonospora viridifaciens]
MTGLSGTGRVAGAVSPPTGVRRIRSEAEASELAHWLLMRGRRWPVVVLTIPGEYDEPFGDPDEIKAAVGDLAEVVLMPTSDVSWAFSRVMPPMTPVYGGAGRVYPVDHAWVADPGRSRLRFAYSPHDRDRITDQLINDALQAAMAAGLVEPRTRSGTQERSGRVQGVIGSRALVTLDDMALATVWEELTVPGVALDRVLAKGQQVCGSYDPDSRRLDLRAALRFTDAATARAGVEKAYGVGDVVLAEVAAVADDAVTVRLLPGLDVEVGREAVTSNQKDTLSGLFSVGETVACRLVAVDPMRLRLDDVDDEEVPKPAPSLLPGGPPWLRPTEPAPQPPAAAAPSSPASVPPVAAPRLPVAPAVAPRQPTPLDLARRLPTPQPAAMARPAGAVPAADQARVLQLTNELAAERATRKVLADELAGLRARAAELEAGLAQATRSIEQLQTRYRGADLARQRLGKELRSMQGRVGQPAGTPEPLFLDPEEQFRYEVSCEWAQRIPAAEKADKPLAAYTLAPGFLDSVEQLEGISRAKVIAVVVEVLTGQAQHLAGRDVHPLRSGDAGSPYVRRPDGAICWRVALQRESAAARRLHYWRTHDGYEFSRVALHDDYRP